MKTKSIISAILFAALAISIIWGAMSYNQKLDASSRQAEVDASTAAANEQTQQMQNLKIEDVTVGTGAEAKNGEMVTVNYLGTLDNGTKFDSSYDRNQPFSFLLGAGQVIKGWDLGVLGMKVGGKRTLTIPPELAYGSQAVGGVIPANSTLHFTVELLSVGSTTAK